MYLFKNLTICCFTGHRPQSLPWALLKWQEMLARKLELLTLSIHDKSYLLSKKIPTLYFAGAQYKQWGLSRLWFS